MKQVFSVVFHRGPGEYDIAVRQRESGFYAKWSCRHCGAQETTTSFPDSDLAFEDAKKAVDLHACNRGSSKRI